jgi:hypothetical protein
MSSRLIFITHQKPVRRPRKIPKTTSAREQNHNSSKKHKIVAHFSQWKNAYPVTVFTTHSTTS